MTDVSTFYGDAINRAPNPSKLADAVKWLDKAVSFEAAGDIPKTAMALKAAHKAEAEALGYPLPTS